jgi:thiol:disulfide interchange protein DsbD
VDDFDRELAAARVAGQPVMFDFYADWCVSCKEMEKYTFTEANVQGALGNAVLLQADVTANDDQDQALMQRFGILGPPSILFFGVDGHERPDYRVVGFKPAPEFSAHVHAAFGGSRT